ncbi:MAG TPA: hypothetical protein DEH22_07035 [Chloroflexi bacterium]|nr:hypothetical protein [Chloroflexota bacterium]
MSGDYLPLLIFLIFVAAFLRDDFAFTLVYLIVGVFLLGNWWSRRAIAGITYQRKFYNRAFLGEKIKVELEIQNSNWLPVPWLQLRDSLPVQLSGSETFNRVLSLNPHGQEKFEYILEGRKRGYYPIGPLVVTSGDLMGLGGKDLQIEGPAEYLTVYPKIVPLASLKFPSRSPLGTLRHMQPIFEDPTRVKGKRDYVAGDSLRRVDWKSTASTGRMQIKLFEPSIALETVLFLDLDAQNYYYRSRIDATELGIVIAASVANWVAGKGQTVGLYTNGEDPLAFQSRAQFLPPRRGKGHLMRILETLARLHMVDGDSLSLARQIQNQRVHLPWGTTLIVITGSVDDVLLDELHQARRAGQNAVIILSGRSVGVVDAQARAGFFGIPVVHLSNEQALEAWGRGRGIAR